MHFWSNRNHFPVDYYFRPHQTPENAEIIFQKSFYAETNGAKQDIGNLIIHVYSLPKK
jgi:hypothetical protein